MGNIFVQLYRAPDRGAIIRREIAKNRDRLRWLLGMPPPREPNGTQECDAEEAGVESSRYLLAEWQGATVLLDRTSLVDKWVADAGIWEEDQRNFTLSVVRKIVDSTAVRCVFLDIGAYWGMYGVLAHKSGVAEVHLFEPDVRNRNQLAAQLFLNDLDRSIHVHDFAVAESDGTVTFRKSEAIDDGNRGGAGIIGPDDDGVTVPCRALDGVFDFTGCILICKIDVEGAEAGVLRGMRRLIADNSVFLQVEVFEDKIETVRAVAVELGLSHVGRIGVDDYYVRGAIPALAR